MSTVIGAAAVTPSDITRFGPTKSVYVGGTGNLRVQFFDQSIVTLNTLPVGKYDLSIVAVLATGTTATNIVALY